MDKKTQMILYSNNEPFSSTPELEYKMFFLYNKGMHITLSIKISNIHFTSN